MLKVFQSIFGYGDTHGRYPESLVDAATERAVDGTDSRIRTVPGYRRLLRTPVINAIDHVVELVDSLPAPIAASHDNYRDDPRLMALFASQQHMLEVLGNDNSLKQFLRKPANSTQHVNALLLADRSVKNVMGIELDGEILRRDVAQMVINFGSYRLVDFSDSEEETRRQLKRRAFDHLLDLALKRITDVRSERVNLDRQRTLLRRKLNVLEREGWSFEEAVSIEADPVSLQGELEEIETQLNSLGANDRALRANLGIAAESLADAEQQLWSESVVLHLDHMNIRRDAHDASARPIQLQELQNSHGKRLVTLLISIRPCELPRQEDFSTAAKRHLAQR